MFNRNRKKSSDDWFTCAHCGATVRLGAKACPECGSDDNTGWSEDADKWSEGIQTGYANDDEFDYDEFVKQEFGSNNSRGIEKNRQIKKLWITVLLVALLVLVALALIANSWCILFGLP